MHNTVFGLMALGVLCGVGAALAGDPGPTCEANKLSSVARYDACRLKADSRAAKASGSADYSRCSLEKFATAEDKAEGMCPTNGDEISIQDFVDACTASVAVALGGGALPLDVISCNNDLAACEAVPIGQVVKSGQTTSYGNADDGDLEPGLAFSYTDNSDGTITDLNTGLMWEKKVGGVHIGTVNCTNETGTCADPHNANNTYVWTANTSPYTAHNGAIVTIFLNQLNNRCDADTTVACASDSDCSGPGGACGFAGHRDWRLPNLKEMVSIVDYSIPYPGPAVKAAFHGASCGLACTDITSAACSCAVDDVYWSATTHANSPANAWAVYLRFGSVNAYGKENYAYARAVRGGA